MAVVLFTVKATIDADQEAAFNKWYNEEHCPQVLRYNGAVSARRYKKLLGEHQYQYMAQYEFKDEATFEAFTESDALKELIKEYDAHFEDKSERVREAWVQVWP